MRGHLFFCWAVLAASLGSSAACAQPAQDAKWPAGLALHNNAVISAEGVLRLDAVQQQYATFPPPAGLNVAAGLRVEARVRLTRRGAGQHVLGRQGTASLYVDSEDHLRAILWTDEGQQTIMGDDPISLNEWHTIVLDYRPDGYACVIVDGKVLAKGPACGLPKSSPGDFVVGRWDWVENGRPRSAYVAGDYTAVKLTAPQEGRRSPGDPKSRLVQHFSWGDMILFGQADTKARIRETLEKARLRGVQVAHWRVDDYVLRTYHRFIPEEQQAEYIRKYNRIVDTVYKEFNPIEEAARVGHELGMKVYGWQCIFDEGAPASVKYADAIPFPWQSKFTIAHPEYCVVDRDGAPQWGVMEYAYAEARQYKVAQIVDVAKRFDLDGVFISTRSHSEPALQGDRFGFNEPVVREFKQRYGRDIRAEEFDREAWRRLRGEYLTQLLRELRAAFPRDRRICVGVPRGDHFGPPFGNLFIDWRTWVREKIVDELVVGEITGVRGLYPKRKKYEGYVFDQESGVGVSPIAADVKDKYGPACRAAGVELYVQGCSPFAPWVLPMLDKGLTGIRF